MITNSTITQLVKPIMVTQVTNLQESQNIPQRSVQLAPYDYLALLPGLITAATPVILCWLQLKNNVKNNGKNNGKNA